MELVLRIVNDAVAAADANAESGGVACCCNVSEDYTSIEIRVFE